MRAVVGFIVAHLLLLAPGLPLLWCTVCAVLVAVGLRLRRPLPLPGPAAFRTVASAG
jgi:hypothetical protein